MSQFPSQPGAPGTTVIVNQQPSNGLGIAGFICSLIGILSCGLLAPLGLLLSVIALFKQPRGFAVAGTVIGLVGSAFFAVIGLGIILGMVGIGAAGAIVANVFETEVAVQEANANIIAAMGADGVLLSNEEGDAIVSQSVDGWDQPLKYAVNADGSGYTITSASMDGQHGTEDDLVSQFDASGNTLNGFDAGIGDSDSAWDD